MADIHKPRKGSMQFWPRKRTRHTLVRVRFWVPENKTKPLGFIAYKAGMTHVLINDNRPKSLTKNETIAMPVTIIECPPMTVMGAVFYHKDQSGLKKFALVLASQLSKHLAKRIQLPKKAVKTFDQVGEFEELRLLVHSNPEAISTTGVKKPKILEIALGGAKAEKLNFAKSFLGKELKINDVFSAGETVDVKAVTKGKGFQGTVKRFGATIRQHKAEKTKRGIGSLGSWTPKRVDYRVPQSGKMGYHQRTEFNKQIFRIGNDGKDVCPPGGITKYGFVNNQYIFMFKTFVHIINL